MSETGRADQFGKEVIRTLLTEVENHRSDLLVVMAGYEGPMEVLLDADPGLRSRFSSRLHLVDYSPEEVARIAELAARRKSFSFADGLAGMLATHIAAVNGDRVCQENGRMAINVVDRAIERLASRLVNSGLSKEQVFEQQSLLTADDFGIDTEGGGGSGIGNGEGGGGGGGGGGGEGSFVGGLVGGVDSEAAREVRRAGRGLEQTSFIPDGGGSPREQDHGLAPSPPPESKSSTNLVRVTAVIALDWYAGASDDFVGIHSWATILVICMFMWGGCVYVGLPYDARVCIDGF